MGNLRSLARLLLALLIPTAVVSAQSTWTGAADADWSNPANWSGPVPDGSIDATIPAGTASSPFLTAGATHEVRSLTVSLGASFTIESGAVVSIWGSLNVAGSVPGGGKLEFVGPQAATWTGSGSVPIVVVSKSGSLDATTTATVRGTFTLLSGAFRVGTGTASAITVLGNGAFVGGSLTVSANATFEVDGDVTFSGTSATGVISSLRCGGNWTGDAAFSPTGGEVVFDGAGQNLAGTCHFAGLRIAAGSNTVGRLAVLRQQAVVEGGASLVLINCPPLAGGFTVAGSLDTTASALDLDGGVNCTGSWNFGSQPCTFSGSLIGTGSIVGTGPITFDGPGVSTLGPIQNLASLRIAKAGFNLMTVGAASVLGDLDLVTGVLQISSPSNSPLVVRGNAFFRGGGLAVGLTSGGIDVHGDVAFSGTACSGVSPDFRCRGNWQGQLQYAPTGGVVTFSGPTTSLTGTCRFPQLVVPAGTQLAGNLVFVSNGLFVETGARVTTTSSLSVNQGMTVQGVLDTRAGPVSLQGALVLNGTWEVGAHPISVGSSLSGSGSLLATSVLTVTNGGFFSNFTGVLPSIRIDVGNANVCFFSTVLTIQGNLVLVSGRLDFVGLTVNGTCQLQGGTYRPNSFVARLDVNGDFVCSGTVCTDSMAIVNCSGEWVGHPAFAPTGGTVLLDGPAGTVRGAARFFDLNIPVGASATAFDPIFVARSLSIGGSLTTAGADIELGVSISASGSWNVGTVACTVGAGIAGPGPVLGTGTITMDGPTPGVIGTTLRLPPIRIAKAANVPVDLNGFAVIEGDLELASGVLRLGNFAGFVLTVNGNGRFLGGRLGVTSACTLDLNGDAHFGGTITSGAIPTILCSGDWNGHPSFTPTSGSVVFDGVDQTISGSATFPAATIAAGTTVHASTGAVFRQTLTVAGTLQSNGMAAQGEVVVSQGGAWIVDPGTTTLSLGLSGLGTVSGPGTLTFDGANSGTLTAFTGLPSLRVAKTALAALDLVGVSSVNGSFELASGGLRVGVAAGQRLDVAGDARFLGGALSALVPGLLVVAGDVRFAGTFCLVTPSIRCGGDWTSDAGYFPTSGGSLTFDGTQPSTIEVTSAARVLRAPGGISIAGAVRTVISDVDFETPSLAVAAGAGISASGRVLNLHATGTPTNVSVAGDLELLLGSRLQMGPATSCSIAAGGSLSLLGTPLLRVVVEGDPVAGGGYALAVDGLVAARNFTVQQPGPNGLELRLGAVVASAPDDLRGGRFDLPASVPGAALLTIGRAQPTQIRYADFANSSAAVGVFNVRCLSGGGIDLVNWSGAFAGSAFEDDPNGLVQWLPQVGTSLASFVAQAGSEKVALEWVVNSVEDAAAFLVERSDGGPYVAVAERPADGSSVYQVVDRQLAAGTTYTYRLSQRLTHGELVVLATAFATPFVVLPSANVLDVGPTGVHATPAAALAAAVLAGQIDVVLRLQPGVHPSFVVDAPSIQSLSIVGAGAGVLVDTTLGPVVVRNVPVSGHVVLSDLVVGSAAAPGPGLRIENCAGLVVVDETEVRAAVGASSAMEVAGSTRMVLQRAVVEPLLFVDAGSFAVVGATSLGALTVAGSSYVQTCEVAVGAVQVGVGSTREALPGSMPEVAAEDLAALGMPLSIEFRSDASQVFAIAVEALPGFAVAPASTIELPVLLAFVSPQVLVVSVTDANGSGGLSPLLPNLPAYLGLHVFVQGAQLGAGTIRMSNLEVITIVP